MTFQAMDDIYSLRGNVKQQREILHYITTVGSSLRLQMDINALLNQVAKATCDALRFHYSVLYLVDSDGMFRVYATFGIPREQEIYLHEHPLPGDVVALLLNDQYRISDSYFIPGESPFWENDAIAKHFVIIDDEQDANVINALALQRANPRTWRSTDLIVVPLLNADNTLLGFITPDAPLDGLRPDLETITYLELFANQAAVVIEGSRLYREAKQNSEERAALVEIGRALSSPDALHDIYTVYKTIHKQVERIMPVECFFIARFDSEADQLHIDYLVDEGVEYAPVDFGTMTPWVHALLSGETEALLFSQQSEYVAFTGETSETLQEDFIGNMRPSESILFVPIRYGEMCLGVLSVQSYRQYAYTQRHAQMLSEVAVHAGIALTNARLYTELRDAVRAAQESEQMKNHFLMTASHEIRTPLTAIQGYLELLSMHDEMLGEDNRSRFLNNARRAAEEVILLLSNVMDTGHIDQNDVVLHITAVSLARVIRVVLDIVEPSLIRQNRQVEVNIDEDIVVGADEERLRQVFLNIIGNALKYTPASTNIAIHTQVQPWNMLMQRVPQRYRQLRQPSDATPFVILSIRDWGNGIAPMYQEQLFERFVRLPDATTRKQRGSGLGLYLCRQLTDVMSGCIWVESEGIEGEGTTFLVALPQSVA